MKSLAKWFNANKILINIKKTELVTFKHKSKKLASQTKNQLSRKRFHPSKSVKYLGVKIDGNLNWKNQTYGIVTNLNKANALLPKTRNYVSFNTLKAIYFEMFD